MKQSKVRCWELAPGVFISYPEGNWGHALISCLNCGQVYAVDQGLEVYLGPPLAKKLSESRVMCVKCTEPLDAYWAEYPDRRLGEDGKVVSFERPFEIPPDSTSLVMEFPEIYSD